MYNNLIKKVIISILILVIALCVSMIASADIVETGNCGTNATWTLDDAGKLTISGTGAIEEHAFYNNTKIKSAVINQGITTIETYAFWKCDNLTSITIPSSVVEIKVLSFYNCTALKTVYMNAGLSSYTGFEYIFQGCTSLTDINFPSNHRTYSSINGVVFNKQKDRLEFYPFGRQGHYTIPDSVDMILSSAFKDCTGLTSVTIPNSVTRIFSQAFENCSLSKVVLSRNIYDIGYHAFDKTVVIQAPKNSYAAQWAYENYYELVTTKPEYLITIYTSFGSASSSVPFGTKGTEVTLTAIPDEGYLFTGWYVRSGGITIKNNKFKIGSSDIVIDAIFEKDPSFTIVKNGKYKLNDKKKTASYIGPKSKTIKSVTIPATIKANGKTYKVTEIASSALQDCKKLTTLTIGANIQKIGKKAFYGCEKLKTITLKTTLLKAGKVGSNAFKNIYSKPTFKCPKDMKKSYKTIFAKKGAPKTAKYK